jgi:multiple sugar transport system substrate-binding protein
MFQDILHAPIPKGVAGQYNSPGVFTDLVMGYSKNQKAAKDFLRWMHSKPIYDQWFTSQQGYTSG